MDMTRINDDDSVTRESLARHVKRRYRSGTTVRWDEEGRAHWRPPWIALGTMLAVWIAALLWRLGII